jgi:hypothetical protein
MRYRNFTAEELKDVEGEYFQSKSEIDKNVKLVFRVGPNTPNVKDHVFLDGTPCGVAIKFTLDEIKTGHRITFEDGSVKFAVRGGDFVYFNGSKSYDLCFIDRKDHSLSWTSSNGLNQDMVALTPFNKTIVKVEKLYHPYSFFYEYNEAEAEVLFERK